MDPFQHAWESLNEAASDDLVESFSERLTMLNELSPHMAQAVRSCQAVFTKETPTLLHMLVATYVINGGILIKHPDAVFSQEPPRPPEPAKVTKPKLNITIDIPRSTPLDPLLELPEPSPEAAPLPDTPKGSESAKSSQELFDDLAWLDEGISELAVVRAPS